MAIDAKVADTTARLNELKARIEKGKVEKTRAETNLEVSTRQREEAVAHLTELGVTPEGLDAELARLELEIEDNLAQAEALLGGGTVS